MTNNNNKEDILIKKDGAKYQKHVSDEEVLKKCIEIAVENGYGRDGLNISSGIMVDAIWTSLEGQLEKMLFSHSFAKALFDGDDKDAIPFWQYHLQLLVLSTDRIDYLRNYLKTL